MENINNHPMFVVEDVAYELRRLSSLCYVMTWMGDDGDHAGINAIVDTLDMLRQGLDTQIRTLDNIQW